MSAERTYDSEIDTLIKASVVSFLCNAFPFFAFVALVCFIELAPRNRIIFFADERGNVFIFDRT